MHTAHIQCHFSFISNVFDIKGVLRNLKLILILYLGLVHTWTHIHVHNMNNNYMTYWAEILLTTQDLIKKYVHVNH